MKYLLLMSYGGADCTPMTEWTAEEIKEHIAFQQRLGAALTESGELVDAQGLSDPEMARIVTSDGRGSTLVTDGPFPESKEFLAGFWLVDVASDERAIEIAAIASAAPGPGGEPVKQQIEVRPMMAAPTMD